MEEAYSFPTVPCKEIMKVLRELGISAPESLLSRPDQASIERVYREWIPLLAAITPEVRHADLAPP